MTSDQQRLMGYVETWRSAADDLVTLLRSLDDEDWARPTDLPGWDVKGVAAHVAHLESDLCGVKQKRVEVPELEHLTAPSSIYTEMGLIAREDLSGAQITDEIENAVAVRYGQLRADPPTDGTADPPRTPGRIAWNWETMLGNRPVDVWMHEQDIRRAVDRPGGMNTAAAQHTVQIFARSFGFTVGKRVAPPAGTTVVLDVAGVSPVHLAVEVNDQGRAVPVTGTVERPTVHLGMDTETFVILAGGRRPASDVPVRITGDQDLGRAVLAAMAVTP
jgi:uncharacterized protein (TIGR03083 family)